jgi:hypothetical protein
MRTRRIQLGVWIAAAAVLALVATSFALAGGRDGGKGKKGDASSAAARLTGYEEVPSVNSPGRAKFTATLSSDKITFTLDYANLTGPPAVAHVHIGQRSANGNVSFFLCGGGGKPPCPASVSGHVEGTVVATDVLGPTVQNFSPGDLAAVLAAIRAGVAYANMHTAKLPGGEIRGQIRVGHKDEHDD